MSFRGIPGPGHWVPRVGTRSVPGIPDGTPAAPDGVGRDPGPDGTRSRTAKAAIMKQTLAGRWMVLVTMLAMGWGGGAPSGAATLEEMPAVVVKTVPQSGAREVAPGETEIRVTFSKEMMDKSWSWSTAWESSTPTGIGAPQYEKDGRTCVLKVKLEPGRTYGYWLNSPKFGNFKDRQGRAAVPYLLVFQTRAK